MKPPTAGILGMVLGLAICIGGGALIARPVVWVLGVIVLIAGTLMFCVAATWMVRKSWAASDWPDVSVPVAKRRRRMRRGLITQCALASIMIGGSVWQIFADNPIFGWFYLLWGVVLLANSIWTLRRLAKMQPSDSYFGQ